MPLGGRARHSAEEGDMVRYAISDFRKKNLLGDLPEDCFKVEVSEDKANLSLVVKVSIMRRVLEEEINDLEARVERIKAIINTAEKNGYIT